MGIALYTNRITMTTSEQKDILHLSPDALAEMLRRGDQVTILDVRTQAERDEWYIPGSMHVDAYASLKREAPGALAAVKVPDEGLVVTVCAAGKTSLTAAEQLRRRGVNAVSLDGGMKAWSLAHNIADVHLAGTQAKVVQVRRTGKGCLSYVIGAGTQAAVIDAALPPEVYVRLAEARGWRITHVVDTHIHADHLSRSRPLAELVGATLYLPEQHRVSFAYAPLREGDVIEIGDSLLRALHTPGHTGESMCFLLDDAGLFTGDTLFTDGVGRPDLEATADEARARAEALHSSLQRLLHEVPSETVVLPGHTSHPVPFNEVVIGDTMGAVRGRVKSLSFSKEDFTGHLLGRIPPTPSNFQRIVSLNEAGTTVVEEMLELEAGANRCAIS